MKASFTFQQVSGSILNLLLEKSPVYKQMDYEKSSQGNQQEKYKNVKKRENNPYIFLTT
jgi:glutaredoxin